MDNKIYFSVDDIQEVATEDSVEFAIARIAVLSTKENSHKINITKEILERDGKSVLGKWVIADFDGTDVTTHTHNTHIIGIVPTDSNIEFVENKDGSTTMYVDAIISKLYATEIYNLFRQHNFRNVSVEMATANDQERADGYTDIDGLNIYSICVLGISVGGSCPDANMSITRFSEKNAEEYYQNTKSFSLKQLAEQRNEKLKVTSHPVDKSKEAVDMGSWNGDKAKDDLLKEKNYNTLAKSVCLLLEDGWEDKVKGALKYPVMNLKDGKWVYNAQGLSSARAYGEQHDPSVADKAISIQKKLGLYKDDNSNKEENMENKELNFSDSEKDKDIIMNQKDSADEKDMACGNKEMAGESEDEKLKEEKKEEDNIKDEEKKMASESEDEKLKEEKEEEKNIADEEKKFSLNAYVDEAAMLSMLENETDEFKELAEKVAKEFSANEIVAKFIEMAKENAELKAEKEKNDMEKKDKKFSAIMASVKEDLDDETYSKLAEEGKELSFDQLGAFENKVKAFAYEATKKNNKNNENNDVEIMKFGNSNNESEKELDVFARISKM